MRKSIALLSVFTSSLLTAGCGDYLELEPDEPVPEYPPLPPPESFPDEPVVTTPGEAPAPPAEVVEEGVHLVFPPPVSITTARHVTVRGTARLAGGVTAVRVNGVDARLSSPGADGAVAWQADVQIASGTSALVVSGVEGGGSVTPAASASITFSPDMLIRPRNMDLDVRHDRLFVSDPQQGLVVIDLDTGASTSVRLAERASSARIPSALSVAPASGRALALFAHSPCGDGSILWDTEGVLVDLHDGTTTSVDEFQPLPDCQGPLYTQDDAAVLDATGESFFYLHYEDRGEPGRAEVRRRPLVDSAPAPMSVPLCPDGRCRGIDMIATRRDQPGKFGLLALVRHETSGPAPSYAVHAIDPVEGRQKRLVTVPTDWDVPEIEPAALAIDPAGNRLFVLAENLSSELHVIGVDLATGAQSLLYTGLATVDGTASWNVTDGIYDPRRDRLIFSDQLRGLITLDLTSGTLDQPYRPAIGDGPVPACPLYYPSSCRISTFDSERQRLFFTEHHEDVSDIYVLDLATGNRRLLSARGGAFEFGTAPLLFADYPEDRLLVVDRDGLLYTVDGVTGEREYVGASNVAWEYEESVAWDPVQNQIIYYVPTDASLHALHVDTLEDRMISSDSVGSGPSLRPESGVPFELGASTVLLDASGTRAFVSRIPAGTVFGVDRATGDRTAHPVDVPTPGADVPVPLQPVMVDTRRNRILIGEHPRHTIQAIDLATGAVTPFVDSYRTEPLLRLQRSLSPDHANDRALVITDRYEVHMLDLQTGQRVLILRSNNAVPDDF